MEQSAHSYLFKSYTELFQTKPENPYFYTRMFFKLALPYFNRLIYFSYGFHHR